MRALKVSVSEECRLSSLATGRAGWGAMFRLARAETLGEVECSVDAEERGESKRLVRPDTLVFLLGPEG